MPISASAAASNPEATLASLLAKREKLQEELRHVEKQVYDLETSYLQESSIVGNVIKGFEGFFGSSKGAGNVKRPRKFQLEDRLFSLSSVTSPMVEEHATTRDSDWRMDGIGQSRLKASGVNSNGPGKPKRGRTQARDLKRMRQTSEPEFDDDDDGDRGSR